MTHPDLTSIDPAWALTELVACKRFIHEHFGQEKCGMAYPGGAYNDATKELAHRTGYCYSRTTRVDVELNTDDPMALHTHCHFAAPDFWEK